jgi:hypothetical protein
VAKDMRATIPNKPTTLQDASNLLARQSAKIEDSAVSEYIRQLATYLTRKGENLADYYLVREFGNLTLDEGMTVTQGVYYGLKHKDQVKIVEFPDE